MPQQSPLKMAMDAIMGIGAFLWFISVIFGFDPFDTLGPELGAVAVTILLLTGLYNVAVTFGILDCRY